MKFILPFLSLAALSVYSSPVPAPIDTQQAEEALGVAGEAIGMKIGEYIASKLGSAAGEIYW